MDAFLISDKLLADLAATHQGRFSLAGYNYQAAYAVARLASMLVQRHVFDLPDCPVRLRYDWGEDLDECVTDERVCFTQCKRIDNIGQPAALAAVLISFAAKWLLVPDDRRDRVRFRLVCSDDRFQAGALLTETIEDARATTEKHFLATLGTAPSDRSDRALWQPAATGRGHPQLFEDLWAITDALFISAAVIRDHPAGLLLPAERVALELLFTHDRIAPKHQAKALDRLRRIVHDGLIEFDPANEIEIDRRQHSPRKRDAADVANALFHCRSDDGPKPPFQVVDCTFLSKQPKPDKRFVARAPDWADVIHVSDEDVKFVERDVTPKLLDDVRTLLVEPIGERFRMLFVTGAPGSGKTTLTRRIAAMLVEEGCVVVADAGIDARSPVDTPNVYVHALQALAAAGRPILFVIDDPLYLDSPWIDLLKKLARPALHVAVLAPCPELLYKQYASKINFAVCHKFGIGPATDRECEELARLYGCDKEVLDRADGFFVIAMQAAAGVPFDEIMRRLWETLNDGQPIAGDEDQWIDKLHWRVRAFLVVSFFHRADVTCPRPLLHAALELSGSQNPEWRAVHALDRLRYENGWRIFRVSEPERQNWVYQGVQISAAHQGIAQGAWQVRPMPWCDIGEWIVTASLRAPQAAWLVGQLAARLAARDDPSDTTFATRLVEAWNDHGQADRIDTRCLYDLAAALVLNGQRQLAAQLAPALRVRAVPSLDGWLAALQLHHLSGGSRPEQTFTAGLDLVGLTRAADFSLAPSRATQFFARLHPAAAAEFKSRLLDSFDGKLTWPLDTALVTWLVTHSSRPAIIARLETLNVWLRAHPDDTSVRAAYLSLLRKLDLPGDELGKVAKDTAAWLKDHPEDTDVRTAFLGLLRDLGSTLGLDELQNLVKVIEALLEDYPHEASVRTVYLDLASQLDMLRNVYSWIGIRR